MSPVQSPESRFCTNPTICIDVYGKGVVDGWRVYARAQMQAEKGGGSGYHNMLAVLGDKQCDGRGISSPQVQASTLIFIR